MAQRESITVGHYTYSGTDVERTIANLDSLWQHHTYDSHIPDGWLAGARGFVAEMCSLGGVTLPSLDNVDSAMSHLTQSLNAKYTDLVPEQREAILAAMWRFFPTMRLLNVEHMGVVQHMRKANVSIMDDHGKHCVCGPPMQLSDSAQRVTPLSLDLLAKTSRWPTSPLRLFALVLTFESAPFVVSSPHTPFHARRTVHGLQTATSCA
jgi:hypothetical protein